MGKIGNIISSLLSALYTYILFNSYALVIHYFR